MPFDFKETDLKDAKINELEVFGVERGFFMETYVKEKFEDCYRLFIDFYYLSEV